MTALVWRFGMTCSATSASIFGSRCSFLVRRHCSVFSDRQHYLIRSHHSRCSRSSERLRQVYNIDRKILKWCGTSQTLQSSSWNVYGFLESSKFPKMSILESDIENANRQALEMCWNFVEISQKEGCNIAQNICQNAQSSVCINWYWRSYSRAWEALHHMCVHSSKLRHSIADQERVWKEHKKQLLVRKEVSAPFRRGVGWVWGLGWVQI